MNCLFALRYGNLRFVEMERSVPNVIQLKASQFKYKQITSHSQS